ncbi:MAG: murein biosynthesis integral membrane protein MurJ [Bryobacteraceae bacterium]
MKPLTPDDGAPRKRRSIAWRMLFDTATVGGWTTAVKLAAAVKVILCARLFGAGDAMDAYLVAFLVPSFFSDVLAGPVDSALIPTLIELREKQGKAAADSVYAAVLAAAGAILFVAAVAVAAFSGLLLPALASSFAPPKLAFTERLLLLMIALVPFAGLSSTWRAVLNSEHKFALAALVPGVTPVISIGVLLAAGKRYGVASLALATLAGVVLEAILSAAGVKRAGHALLPRWSGLTPAVRQVAGQYAPLAAITFVMTGSTLLDQAMAARLAPGSVSALSYGTRLLGVLVAIAPTAVGTAVLPHISTGASLRAPGALRRTLRTYGFLILAVILPLIALLMYFSEPIIRILFQQGAFSESATRLVAAVQSVSLLQLPMAVFLALEIRLSSAVKGNRILYRVAGMTLLLTLVADVVLMRWFGVVGIVLAGAVVRLVSSLYLSCKISVLSRETLASGSSIA